jgi:hypothetical protein
MNNAEKFKKDLSQGQCGEYIISKWLEKYKGYKTIKFNDNNLYDILMEKPNGSSLTIECKTDRWEFFNKETGNIFIETRCSNKPSGIWSSIADVYAFYFPDYEELYFISTSKLKDLLKNNQELFEIKTLSGDGGKVSGFVINRYKNENLFNKVHIKKEIWKKVYKKN